MLRKMIWMLLITGGVFGAIFGFKAYGNRMMQRSFDTMQPPVATVATAVAEYRQWPAELRSVGTLVARQGTHVAPEAEGVVSAIRFESGQEVAAGTVLVELDSSVERGRVAALQAQLELARLEQARYRDLAARELTSRSELDLRNSQVDRLEAEIRAEQAVLERKVLRAPFAGELGIRRVSLGDYLKAGDPVVSLQALQPIYLDFSLPERVLAEVKSGQQVSAELDAWPGRIFSGSIAAIEPEIDTGTRNFRLRAELENAERLLHPGGFARVRVQVAQPRPVLALPQTAIRFDPYGKSVFVLQGEAGDQRTVHQRFVRTGAAYGDLVAVADGLKPGEEVAISGLLKLRNGAQVEVDNAVRPSTEASPQPVNR